VWGYDFFGGARTVDVHVRKLRAKLGSEHEQLIGTVRSVGYTSIRPGHGDHGPQTTARADGADGLTGPSTRTTDPVARHV
jgi:DNA-binding winged helix-turn-helix (wHTH) protein